MESGPLSTPEFKEFAKDVVLFCHITTRIKGRKHDDLLGKVGGRGFPHLVVMNAEGDVLSVVQRRSVEGFRAAVEAGEAYQALKSKADRTPDEELELIQMDLDLGNAKPAEALERLQGLEGADPEKVSALEAKLEAVAFDATIDEVLQSAGQPTNEAEQQAAIKKIGTTFWEHYQAGKRPSGAMQASTAFYSLLMQYGLNEKLVEPARAGLDGIVELHGSNPQAKAQIEKFRKEVEALEAGK